MEELQGKTSKDAASRAILNSAEYTVFQLVLKKSGFGAVLNEGDQLDSAESIVNRITTMFTARK